MFREWLVFLLFVFFLCGGVFPAEASQPLYTSAESAILMDAVTGTILYAKNAHIMRPMASTTKIATAILALEIGDLKDRVRIGPKAAGKDGSSMYLRRDELVNFKELLYGIMLNSGNDACVAVAEHLCGSEEAFVDRMNKLAAKIGARRTRFANTSGLPAADHYSTAYDLALLTRYAIKNPFFRELAATKYHYAPATNKMQTRYMCNHNRLLWRYKFADGVKTGYTREAGKCLVASGTKDGQTLIAVALNSSDMYGDTSRMLDYGFSNYYLYKPWKLGKPLAYIKISGRKKAPLVASREINLLLPSAWPRKKLHIRLRCPRRFVLPFLTLQKKGWVEVYYTNRLLARVPLVALNDSPSRRNANVKVKALKHKKDFSDENGI
ncbi:MAG: D-alanyl-D-alanine carboxypeptidase family protein [Bacillota bacterium]